MPSMMFPDAILSVFVATFVLAYIVWKFVSECHNTGTKRPPTLWSLPLIGSALFLPDFRIWHREFLRMSAKMGDVFAFYVGSYYTVVLNGKEAIHEAFVKHSLDFSDRPTYLIDATVFNIHAKGIINHRYNAEFRRQRKLSLSILKEFGFGKDIMEERIQAEVMILLQRIRDVKYEPFCPHSDVMSSVLNVIVSILFGRRMEDEAVRELTEASHRFLLSMIDLYAIDILPLLRFLPKVRRNFATSVAFHEEMFRIIRSSIETADEDSFVKYYMNREGGNLDREQLEFIMRDLILAGTETSTSTLLFAILLLASRDGQHIQEQLWSEIDSQVPRERLPSLADRSRMPLVEATIMEVMRIKTVVPLALSHWTSRDTTVGGYFIPANTLVLPNLYSVHMDPEVWEEPEKFRPGRFLDEHGKVVGKERIMPFSVGRRSCLGELLAEQEIYLFLAAIVQNFVIKPPDGSDEIACEDNFSVTLSPSHFTVQLLPRSCI